MPHNTVDPIALAALLVLDLQTIVSREVNPIHPAVVTVGSIHGGTKHNIIPNDVKLQLTLRAFRPEVADQLVEGIRRRAKGLAEAHRAPRCRSSTLGENTPPTVNTPSLVAKVVPMLVEGAGDLEQSSRSSRRWAPRTSASSARGAFRPSCSASARSRPRRSPAKAKGETLPSLHSRPLPARPARASGPASGP